jgi:V8-like Glu-specific endopeptidase
VRAERLEKLSTSGLEKVLGDDRYVTLTWYIKGLARCRAVARIETTNEDGIGTGFLVPGRHLHPHLPDVVLMTNGHVVPEKLSPQETVVAFRGTDADAGPPQKFGVARQWWSDSSQPGHLDATLLELDGVPRDVEPVPLATRVPNMQAKVTPRAYVIGHPRGLEQPQFSLQDNKLLAIAERVLHYRSPTEPGSSGSPVFDREWNLIAIHHAGDDAMPRIDGQPGFYAANEGIRVSAIISALASGGLW